MFVFVAEVDRAVRLVVKRRSCNSLKDNPPILGAHPPTQPANACGNWDGGNWDPWWIIDWFDCILFSFFSGGWIQCIPMIREETRWCWWWVSPIQNMFLLNEFHGGWILWYCSFLLGLESFTNEMVNMSLLISFQSIHQSPKTPEPFRFILNNKKATATMGNLEV